MKKILSVLLVALMIVSLAACNNEEEVIHPNAVIMEKEEITLQVGQEETLSAIVDLNATDRSVTWSSSDNAIATVDANGKVTAVAEGTATITVTTNDGGKTATCTVTVVPAPAEEVLRVKGINVLGEVSDTDYIAFRSDGTYTAYGMFLGAVEFTYDSTYEVVDGVLTVPNPGPNVTSAFGEFPTYPTVEVYGDTVRFSVLSNNGEDITLGYYVLSAEDAGKLGITVGEPIEEVAVTGISLTQDTVTLTSGAKLDLTGIVSILPENATNKDYTITIDSASNAGKVLMEDNGILGLSAGTATVTVASADGGFTATCTVNVVYPDKVAAVSEANYFAATTAMVGKQDLTAFGGSVSDVVYMFNTDGSLEIYKNYVLVQRGYYSLIGTEGSYTQINLQAFFDGEGSKAMTYVDGKLSFDAGIEGVLPLVLTEAEMDTNGHFDADVTFAGTLDLSAYVPGLVQEKVWTCHADGTVTSTTDGVDDGKTNSYSLISCDGKVISIVFDMGADGVFTCTLNETDGIRSFTIAVLSLTMTEQTA